MAQRQMEKQKNGQRTAVEAAQALTDELCDESDETALFMLVERLEVRVKMLLLFLFLERFRDIFA